MNDPSARPPRLATWLVARTCPERSRDAMLGDLEEEFRAVDEARGAAAARRFYWTQALRSAGPNLGRRRRERATAAATGGGGMDGFARDVRQALKGIVRRPVFSAVVAVTLALGIGANTIIFSAVKGMILNPFPFPEPDRIVGVGTAYPRVGADLGFFENASPAEFEDVRDRTATLEDVVAFDLGNRQLSGEGPPENVLTAFWWGDALRTLGMDAHLGRGFTDEEIRTGAAVAILSHRHWQQRLGADSSLVGSTIAVNGDPHVLVGVAPPGVLFYGADLWKVMPVAPSAYARDRRQFEILARVRAGVPLEAVNAELETLARSVEAAWAAEFPEYAGWHMEARTWTDINVAMLRPAGLILTGAVGFLLLLVCSNVANMLLARAQSRRREMAVRAALGAGRGRLVRQLLTESVVLALAGGVLGLVIALAGVSGVREFLSSLGLPVPGEPRVDGTVLAFTAVVAVVTGLLFGAVPALQTTRAATAARLREEGGVTGSRSRQALQRFFVGLEVALALVLLVGGGLLVNTLVRLQRVDPGFDADHLLTMRLTVPPQRYTPDEIQAFFQDLTTRAADLPGVRAAAAALQVPGAGFSRLNFTAEGVVPPADAPVPRLLGTLVTHGYFEATGIPIVAGRGFHPGDGPGGQPVAVLNQAAARVLFPGEDPVGRRIRTGGPDDDDGTWLQVVGVAADIHNRGLDQPPEPEVYASQEQIGAGQNQMFLLVRTVADPRAALPAVRDLVASLDPEQPVYMIATARERYASGNAARRATAVFLGLFSGFALLLAAVGIYAVVGYAVTERTREIGLRLALGADAGRVRRLVVSQALVPVVLGAGAGLGLAGVVARGMEGLLFGVSGTDPATLAVVTAILLAVALAASWIPARRASRLDPVRALARE